MAKGFAGIKQASADVEARRGQSSGPGALYFRLQDGEDTVVRFLEQDEDITWCWMHEIPVEGRAWGRQVPCLDQDREGNPCPGCERDMDRRFRGFINVIWDDAPIFKRDAENKIVRSDNQPVVLGHKPQVAVWSAGIRLFEELEEINANYKGLMSRRFKVKRRGSKLDTKYIISPANVDGGPEELTAEENALSANKFDLNEFVTPMSYGDFAKQLGGGYGGNGNQGGQQQGSPNPFMRNR